jgi:hypothetical protein
MSLSEEKQAALEEALSATAAEATRFRFWR